MCDFRGGAHLKYNTFRLHSGYISVTFGYFSVTFRLYFGYIPLTRDIPFLYKIQSGYNHVNVTCITGYVVTKRDVTEK